MTCSLRGRTAKMQPFSQVELQEWKERGPQALLAGRIAEERLEAASVVLSWARMTIRKVRRGLPLVRATVDARTDCPSNFSA